MEENKIENIRDLCNEIGLDPDMTLREYVESVIEDILQECIKNSVSSGEDFTSLELNEFFNCEDIIELTWEEIYTTLNEKCLLVPLEQESNPGGKIIHVAETI